MVFTVKNGGGFSCTLSLKLMTNGVLIFDKSSHIGLANLGPGEILVGWCFSR